MLTNCMYNCYLKDGAFHWSTCIIPVLQFKNVGDLLLAGVCEFAGIRWRLGSLMHCGTSEHLCRGDESLQRMSGGQLLHSFFVPQPVSFSHPYCPAFHGLLMGPNRRHDRLLYIGGPHAIPFVLVEVSLEWALYQRELGEHLQPISHPGGSHRIVHCAAGTAAGQTVDLPYGHRNLCPHKIRRSFRRNMYR